MWTTQRRVLVQRLTELDLAAASGLVAVQGQIYVVADDQLTLAVYDDGGAPLGRVPLFPGALPVEAAARKAAKPDLEALVLLPGGRLLALGSGSQACRARAALLTLPTDGKGLPGAPRVMDLAQLYAALGGVFAELNIEGAAVVQIEGVAVLRMLQRGNGHAGDNALIDLDLDDLLAVVDLETAWPATLIRAVQRVQLGRLDGVALGFTDASPLTEGRLLFVATAEGGGDTYHDGPCVGSGVGVLDAAGEIAWLAPLDLDPALKIEGVHATRMNDGDVALVLVADADDPARKSPLLQAWLRGGLP